MALGNGRMGRTRILPTVKEAQFIYTFSVLMKFGADREEKDGGRGESVNQIINSGRRNCTSISQSQLSNLVSNNSKLFQNYYIVKLIKIN